MFILIVIRVYQKVKISTFWWSFLQKSRHFYFLVKFSPDLKFKILIDRNFYLKFSECIVLALNWYCPSRNKLQSNFHAVFTTC